MNGIVFAGLSPHPPIIVPEVGRGETAKVDKTISALEKMAELLRESKPETLVVITPHGPLFEDVVTFLPDKQLFGTLASFGARNVTFNLRADSEFVSLLENKCDQEDIPAVPLPEDRRRMFTSSVEIDHGTMVPLYYLLPPEADIPVVIINIGLVPRVELYRLGMAIRDTACKLGRRTAVLASGDLSHRLQKGIKEAWEFDKLIKASLEKLDVRSIIELPEEFVDKAGECGLRPIIIMLGALDGLDCDVTTHSYEGPFGVGYLVTSFKPLYEDESRQLLSKLTGKERSRVDLQHETEDPHVALAREALETYVREGKRIKPPEKLPPELRSKAGVFVSLKKHGQLRGCIGTIQATTASIAAEIIRNAIEAGTGDPRFAPVREAELADLTYSVDVLTAPVPANKHELNPKKYGVIVKRGMRRGLLLPDLPGVGTVDEQLEIARQKAGIRPGEDIEIYRFEVKRYY